LFATTAIPQGSAIGDHAAATTLCTNSYTGKFQNAPYSLTCPHIVPLLAYAADNGVQSVPAHYGVPTDRPFVGPTGTPIASDWSSLLGLANVGTNLLNAGVLTHASANTESTWTGFDSTGALTANCNDWSANSTGSMIATYRGWTNDWTSGTDICNNYYIQVMCMCWY